MLLQARSGKPLIKDRGVFAFVGVLSAVAISALVTVVAIAIGA